MDARKTVRLEWIQVGRAIAALVVVASHMRPFSRTALNSSLQFGAMGVEFFFLLSGFIIYHAHRADIGSPKSLTNFLWKRATRIFPTYWIAFFTVLLITFLFVSDVWRPQLSASFFLHELFLLPGHSMFVGPAWTLRHELLFYVFFALLIRFGAAGWALFGGWMVAAAINSALAPPDMHPTGTGWQILLHHYNLDFALGLAAAMIEKREHRSRLFFASLCIAVPFLVAWQLLGGTAASWCQIVGYKFAFLTVLIGAVLLSLRGIPAPSFMVFLGAASYAIYLLNRDVGFTMDRVFNHISPGLGDSWLGFIFSFAAAALAGVMLYVLFERPVLRHLGRIGARFRP